MNRVILNADVGEGAGFDREIMRYVSWCNIACGAHAGSEKTIQDTIDLAIKHNVKIGAHPSFPDKENFGRVVMNMEYAALVKSITDQIALVKYHTEKRGQKLYHVKPHGALYNEAIQNKEVARAIVESVHSIDKSLTIITTKESMISYLYSDVVPIKYEAFADRNYNEDLTLVSRAEKNAVIEKPKRVCEHVYKMVSEGKVRTKSGKDVSIFFDTICIHGDNPKSVEILEFLHKRFPVLNVDFGEGI